MGLRDARNVPSNVRGVLKKSVTEIVKFGNQSGLVCWRNQQTASQQ